MALSLLLHGQMCMHFEGRGDILPVASRGIVEVYLDQRWFVKIS